MCNHLRRNLILILLTFANSIDYSYSNFAREQCPGTNVPNIIQKSELSEISLIFYYTQWSEESLKALQQFNDVAKYFGDKIYFSAIDCWHLECNCSKTLTTIGSGYPQKWPTLMVHYAMLDQLKFQYSGLFTFRDILNFIMNILYPLERIAKREDLEKIQPLTDGIVLGVFTEPIGLEYKHYLIAALKWLEYDPARTYRFTVTLVSSMESVDQINVRAPNIMLLTQKAKKIFTDFNDFKWNASNILHWLHKEFNDEYNIRHGYSTPISIGQRLKNQPILAVFVNEPQQFFKYMEKYVDSEKPFSSEALLACKNAKKVKELLRNWKDSLRISEIMQNFIFKDNSKCHYHKDIILKNLRYYYEISDYFKLYQKHFGNLNYKPNLEAYELLDFIHSTTCLQKEDIALQNSLHINIAKRLEMYLRNEQQCKSANRSLGIILSDTHRYIDFLRNLDILPTPSSMATIFIIDNDKENIYVMEDRFAMFNLMEFVKKFYSNGLSNYYKNKVNIPLSLLHSSHSPYKYDIELKQLNRNVFLNYLQHVHNQTIVMLLYSPDCALCSNILHSFLQLTLSLRNIINLKFIRINVMDNDLPWQINMPFLPALLVFPQNRFSESRLFPTHLKPNIRNILGFILSQLSAHQQVNLVLAMCQNGTLPKNHTQSCWQFAKTILMQHIGKHLQYWQIFETERNLILERLRAFKDMSLDVQRNLRL